MRCNSLFIGLALLLNGCLCHAQESEIYLTAVVSNGLLDTFYPHVPYDFELTSDHYSHSGHFNLKHYEVFKGVPQGPLNISISSGTSTSMKPFSDSLNIHKGINAIIIEMDVSGEQQIKFPDPVNGGYLPVPPEWKKAFGLQDDGTYHINKPSRPKVITIDGQRALESGAFFLPSGINNLAIEVMEKNGWAKPYSNPEGPVKHALILLDPDVHWSWKNGAYVFWKDEEN